MKNIFLAFAMLFLGGTLMAQTVNLSESSLKWSGSDVTGKTHYGSLKFSKAELKFTNEALTGGTFQIDMNTLAVEDLSGEWKEKLEGHLRSDDFFSIDKFGTAYLLLNEVNATDEGGYSATGDLTIKGITHPVSVSFQPSQGKMNATMTFDRSLYEVKFRSGSFFENLGDKLILDDITVEASLVY